MSNEQQNTCFVFENKGVLSLFYTVDDFFDTFGPFSIPTCAQIPLIFLPNLRPMP